MEITASVTNNEIFLERFFSNSSKIILNMEKVHNVKRAADHVGLKPATYVELSNAFTKLTTDFSGSISNQLYVSDCMCDAAF